MTTKLFFYISIYAIAQSCNSGVSNSTTLSSKDFNDKNERILILKNEIKTFSDFSDAEFYLVNANGFSNQRISVPGASSWNYQFVIKVDISNINKWIEGMTKVPYDNKNDYWLKKMPNSRKANWKVQSIPEEYRRVGDNVIALIYKSEGIIYKEIRNN